MKKILISPSFRSKFPADSIENLLKSPEGFGLELYNQILIRYGGHIFEIGNTRAGKTNKKHYFLWWMSKNETVIEFDTGKQGDIEPFFDSPNEKLRYNKPIQILVPAGCTFEVTGNVPEDLVIKVTPVPLEEMFFDMIEPGWINIISLRNFFMEESKMKQYLIRIFRNFELRARLHEFDYFCPCVISFDEAHLIMGSQGVNRDSDSILLTQYLAKWQREMAACRIRLFIISQRFYDLPPAIRENAPSYVVNRGVVVNKVDHPTLNYLSGFARTAEPWEGWVVMPNGRHFYSDRPIKFPHFEIPKIQIRYQGYVDRKTEEQPEELMNDGGYREQLTLIPVTLEDQPEEADELPEMGSWLSSGYGQQIQKKKTVIEG